MAMCSVYDFDQLPLVLKVPDLMAVLGLGRGTIYELIRSGQIPSLKVGRNIIIPRDGVLNLLSCAEKHTKQ